MTEFAIIGGGIAGLATAIGLQSLQRDFMLFEQSKMIKGIGAGFGLAANAMQALDYLGLKKDIEAIGHHLPSYNILDQNGHLLLEPNTQSLQQRYHQGNFAIHRADLHHYLQTQIPKDNIELERRAIRFEEHQHHITIHFQDGYQHDCRYLLIADGVKSLLRQQLLPQSLPRHAGYTCWRAVINNDIQLKRGSETWGKDGRFGLTPLVDNRLFWYACINSKPNNSILKNYTVTDLIDCFKDYHPIIKQVLEKTNQEDLIWGDILDIKPLKHFAFNHVLLLGDAAHATTPNMGQGACQALEDVAVLIDELKDKKEVKKAFLCFEKRRLDRTKYIIDTSRWIGSVAQWDNPWLIQLRNFILKHTPSRWTQNSLNKLLQVNFMELNNK